MNVIFNWDLAIEILLPLAVIAIIIMFAWALLTYVSYIKIDDDDLAFAIWLGFLWMVLAVLITYIILIIGYIIFVETGIITFG